jgi:hypothetical protein
MLALELVDNASCRQAHMSRNRATFACGTY